MSRRTQTSPGGPRTLTGVFRIDTDPKHVASRVRSGDIAVIDRLDLDRASAEALVAREPAVVLNVQPTLSGRFPAGGAQTLIDAGILLIDRVGADILAAKDGSLGTVTLGGGPDAVTVDDDKPWVPYAADDAEDTPPVDATPPSPEAVIVVGDVAVTGHVVAAEDVEATMSQAHTGLPHQLAAFTANAMDVVERSGGAVIEGEGLPPLGIDVSGRHVLVIAPGAGHAKAVKALREYVKERKPVVIAVDEAADAAVAAKIRPDVVVGDVSSISEKALAGAARVIVHDPAGQIAAARVDALSASHDTTAVDLASEDLAILLAHHGEADVIVTAGVATSLVDLLESGRPDAASTFLTRLSAGARIVDAHVIAALYRSRFSWGVVIVAVVVALAALGAALWLNADSRAWIESLVGAAS